jgi:hypothetical protein
MVSNSQGKNWFHKTWDVLTGEDVVPAKTVYPVQRALQTTTVKLVQVQHQIDRLQSQHNLEMVRLAQAYQELSAQERHQLPPKLRTQLDRIEREYY